MRCRNVNLKKFKLSSNGQKLIHLYEAMANEGYNRTDGVFVETAFSDFELKKFRKLILLYFTEHEIKSVLDGIILIQVLDAGCQEPM